MSKSNSISNGAANVTYGEVREDLHFTGYAFERGCRRLKDLLVDDKWKDCGTGFTNIEAFLASLQLDRFRKLTEERRELAALIKAAQPAVSNRAIAKAMGVGRSTINDDVAETRPQKAKKANGDNEGAAGSRPPSLGGAAAAKAVARAERGKERQSAPAAAREVPPDDLPPRAQRCRLICSPIAQLAQHVEANSVDWIITDPPYGEEFLPCYGELAAFAAHALRPSGSCLVLTGQTYLPAVVAALGTKLNYHWCSAYLTPGGQAAQIWPRKVNCFWKPLLWYVKGEFALDHWIGDVCRSDINDNDKRFHHWGQSESGTADIVTRFTAAGNLIVDPFLGGGTTAVVALDLDRQFIGADSDAAIIAAAEARLRGGA